jgi:hypothetical protein
VASVLSKVGIDISANRPVYGGDYSWDGDPNNDVTSPRIPESQLPGTSTLLSGAGSDELKGFENDDLFVDRGGGDDTFYGPEFRGHNT